MQFTRLACCVVASALFGCGGGDDDDGTTEPPPPPQTLGSITPNVSSLNLEAGKSESITISVFDPSGARITNFPAPTFSSTTASVAEVDASGTILALSAGTSTINVSLTMQSITKTATVSVTVTGVLPTQADVSTTSGDVFTPNRVVIAQGGQVTWIFGNVEHTVVFSTAGAPAGITSGGLQTAISRTFAQVGNFSYNCTIHAGMNGQVIVK